MMSEADCRAIEEAVLSTARGRWFLSEYARRIRSAETDRILHAIATLAAQREPQTALPLAAPSADASWSEGFAAIDALPLAERLKLTG